LPGFGFTVVPPERNYTYNFENIGQTIEAFTHALKLDSFAIYIFDYGAPTGLRLALARPNAVKAIISQNGNAFEEGLGDFWDNLRPYWADSTQENRDKIKWLVTMDATKWQVC
jgi:pimeloyl-ACP methyl ester carboxylesterase